MGKISCIVRETNEDVLIQVDMMGGAIGGRKSPERPRNSYIFQLKKDTGIADKYARLKKIAEDRVKWKKKL